MRMQKRSFVVETKARHKLSNPLQPILGLAKFAPSDPAPRAPEGDTLVVERPKPKRVLPAIEQPRPEIEPPLASEDQAADEPGRVQPAPRTAGRAASIRTDKARSAEARAVPAKPKTPRVAMKPVKAAEAPVARQIEVAEAFPPTAPGEPRAVTRGLRDRSGQGSLPPGMEWAARLPDAVKQRLMARSRRGRR